MVKAEMERAELETRFTYHAPKDGQAEKYAAMREEALCLALMIYDIVPSSRERSLAITQLEQCVMWANAAIARRG